MAEEIINQKIKKDIYEVVGMIDDRNKKIAEEFRDKAKKINYSIALESLYNDAYSIVENQKISVNRKDKLKKNK